LFGERQIDIFRDVLLRLIESAEPDMLTPLSMILCGETSAPKDVVRLLAPNRDQRGDRGHYGDDAFDGILSTSRRN
jgi:hypothetical protein